MIAPTPTSPRPIALTIAGSDAGGGAGIQADLRTFGRLDVFGTTAITAVTAQNLTGVRAVSGVPDDVVAAQIAAVLDGFAVRALKTGMLWSAAIVERVAAAVEAASVPAVVDPVMVATSGARLLREDAIDAYRERLIPRCALLTPNLDEAAVLLDRDPVAPGHLDRAARALGERFGCAVLLKGGHLAGDPVDVLWHAGRWTRWRHPRLGGVDTHGSGCTLSAAIAAWLARGVDLEAACGRALAFTHDALAHPHTVALGAGPARLAGIEHADPERAPLEIERADADLS